MTMHVHSMTPDSDGFVFIEEFVDLKWIYALHKRKPVVVKLLVAYIHTNSLLEKLNIRET